MSRDWDPPTASPAIKHLVVILQDGRSFDSYFGQYCQSEPGRRATPPTAKPGLACCEAMPPSIPGAADVRAIGSPRHRRARPQTGGRSGVPAVEDRRR